LFKFYYHDLNKELSRKLNMKPIVLLLSFAAVALVAAGLTDVAFAEEEVATGGMSDGSKLIGAGIAFGVAAGGAGVGLGQVGAAGLAVISENPALQSKVFIFVGMVESIAIYGIVMMFIILGQ
jgi:V/A-type H+-transporting ATPase subunit K